MNWKSLITVVFVWFLIFFLAFSYFWLFLPALYEQSKLWFYVLTISGFILITLGCISYFKAIVVSPGYVYQNLKYQYNNDKLEDFQFRAEQQKQFKRLRKNKKNSKQQELRQIQKLTQNSYCQKCDNVKLSRVHHCKQCQTCIRRMDHHCPWVGNCVGKNNHKYFLLFLFYVSLALFLVFISILVDYLTGETVLNHVLKLDEIYYYIILAACVMSCLLLLSIGFLLITQLMMIYSNLTTLESFYNGIFDNNPFDLGCAIKNFKQIMGNSCWLLPTEPFAFCDQQKNIGLI